ncbi:ABC-2 transporter permease [Methanocorpusculum vombati]|uniref:ABC-2 transporter permease n=1 Tax=Methanocorpusculum vombati TaxID=3002864 RepID=A0ABT4IMQ1_9EURY|nr:ABC-2 transporter permease [Methanocorpusculum vombati]MCZ9318869.1 ABC-2 transporter permease [Methanocorpusculum sp.]MDE2520524.1 ABC-2 transporter permease [Methanocorpusculum sp.]MDE2534606.1 ABC-2 transporter permease [Methanocorpusculum sp.]MDE2546535.1 ABC-2 transporter permease [Methanocorpusculum sp.]
MNGLLYKDLLNLNPTMKYLAFMALIFCVVFIPLGNELPVYIILIMFGATLPVTAISFDTAARWDKYAASLPLSRREIVAARYSLMIGGICVAGIISLAIAVVMTVLMPGEGIFLPFIDPLPLMVMFVACGLVLGSIALPLTLKFGPEKMRYIVMVIALTPVVLMLGMMFLMDLSGIMPASPVLLPVLLGVLLAVTAVVVVVSYLISVRIYRKKEF